jgi:hypothetical protein
MRVERFEHPPDRGIHKLLWFDITVIVFLDKAEERGKLLDFLIPDIFIPGSNLDEGKNQETAKNDLLFHESREPSS